VKSAAYTDDDDDITTTVAFQSDPSNHFESPDRVLPPEHATPPNFSRLDDHLRPNSTLTPPKWHNNNNPNPPPPNPPPQPPPPTEPAQCQPASAATNNGKPIRLPNNARHPPKTPPNTLLCRYAPTGERLVAGVVPLSPTLTHVLLIQSSTLKGWVLPKGGWETDENLCSDAALREAWEEAGIECSITKDLGTIEEKRSEEGIRKSDAEVKRKGDKGGAPRARYRFYEVRVNVEREVWPESWKRRRSWMSYGHAREELRGRPELLEALERSGIKKT
jgi:diphosphoinositol-polyphosphate diphosphatase